MSNHPSSGHPWRSFRRTLFHFDRGKINAARGLRNAAGVALPLVLGAFFGRMGPALVVATGALNVGFADSTEPYLPRVRRMLAACVLVTLAVFCGPLAGWNAPTALIAAAVWAFGAGMLVCLGTQTGNIGVSCTCVLLIFASHPLQIYDAAMCALLALGGGLFQTCLSVLLWPVRPYTPERAALASLYQKLASLTAKHTSQAQGPPGTASANEATEALAGRAGDHSTDSIRYRALLDQAERIRVCLISLAGLRERLRDPAAAPMLDAFLAAAGRVLEDAAAMLRTGRTVPSDGVQEVQRLLDEYRGTEREGVLNADIDVQMDALARQLRIILGLAGNATPTGREQYARTEAAHPWWIRPGSWTTLRANLNIRSTAFRHALRLSACVATADAFGRGMGWGRPYWLPLTVTVVLKPDFSSTFSRGVLRLAGTFVGLFVATILFHALPQTPAVEIALIMAATFILRWSGPAHYGVLAMCVSELVVLLVALTGVAPGDVILLRARNTALGGVLALLAYWLWPTWEKTQVAEHFARMLEAYRDHFALLARDFAGEDLEATLDRTRNIVRLARTNLEASVDRLAGEPATNPREREHWMAMLTSSHIFANAVISLHSGLLAAPEPLRPLGKSAPFQDFARAVCSTLERIAAALRGGAHGDFPDLRRAHYDLIHSGAVARHSLVSVEADKIVNALNTLREQAAPRPQTG